jgi:diketogulonate reductase-like aldo/keto reductase
MPVSALFRSMSEPSVPRRTVLRLGAASLASLLMSELPSKLARADQPLLTRAIPSSGEALPAVGLGTWQAFDVAGDPAAIEEARETLKELVATGGRVIDSSPMYGSAESVAGQLMQELAIRDRVFVATKVWTEGRNAGRAQMDASMRKLRVERLDLMQVHNLVDTGTHLDTLREWKAAGRVRYVGVTHYHSGAHGMLEKIVRSRAVEFVQVNYSLAEPEADRRLLQAAADSGVAVVVNRPFAEGAMFRRVKGRPLPDWAAALGCASWAQVFLKWILGHPAVTCAIPGTRNPRHLADNLAAARGPMPDAAARRRIAEHFASL